MYKIIHLPTADFVRWSGRHSNTNEFPVFHTKSLAIVTNILMTALFFEHRDLIYTDKDPGYRESEPQILYSPNEMFPTIYKSSIPRHLFEILEVPDV